MPIYKGTAGAPKRGREHWVHMITKYVLPDGRYEKYTDQKGCNYTFVYRSPYIDRWDITVVIRTSRRCYRVTYFDLPGMIYRYGSAKNLDGLMQLLTELAQEKERREHEYYTQRKAQGMSTAGYYGDKDR